MARPYHMYLSAPPLPKSSDERPYQEIAMTALTRLIQSLFSLDARHRPSSTTTTSTEKSTQSASSKTYSHFELYPRNKVS